MDSNFKHKLQQSADHYRVKPNDEAWNKLSTKLRNNSRKQRKMMNRFLKLSAIMVVAVLIIAVLLLYYAKTKS